MLINYFAGIIAQHYGVQQVLNVALVEVAVMVIICLFIRKRTLKIN